MCAKQIVLQNYCFFLKSSNSSMIFLQNMAFFPQNAPLCGVLEPTFHGHMRDVGFHEDVSDGVESEFLVERDSLCLSMKT